MESDKDLHKGRTVTFQVDEVWKGIENGRIEIKTGLNSGDCGFPFVEGESYLVFANTNDFYEKDMLTTTICQRTNQLAEASDDLTVLGNGKIFDHSFETDSHKSTIQAWPVVITIFVFLVTFSLINIYRRNAKG
ncbi:hypothetical protein [Sporosarcina sp. Te-1]|uniref:hypothetical protein n=1 Tax=Sporosarcina sp. Te-1 TaxID=2818390 RepID=UPI001A9D4765|nr:hypothetical protein [Sporosarcina sp. Te-1]QTD41348.1 hypothetical protein J3U78_00285 [Sporosarcina sp. Te-1]